MFKNRKLWQIKLLILLFGILPSFTTYFIELFNSPIFNSSDIPIWYLMYIIITFLIIYFVSGKKTLLIGIATASALAISVVFVGGFIAYTRSGFSTEAIPLYSQHYIIILLNTMAVLPISIALISAIPIREYEFALLNKFYGVSGFEKNILIGTRIFNNIIYTVFPNIVLIRREENKSNELTIEFVAEDAFFGKMSKVIEFIKRKILEYFYLLLTILINSIEFIPLWAIEISKLPSKKELNNEK